MHEHMHTHAQKHVKNNVLKAFRKSYQVSVLVRFQKRQTPRQESKGKWSYWEAISGNTQGGRERGREAASGELMCKDLDRGCGSLCGGLLRQGVKQ